MTVPPPGGSPFAAPATAKPAEAPRPRRIGGQLRSPDVQALAQLRESVEAWLNEGGAGDESGEPL